jgi:tetratricopeptide (TPR) repeat protein
MTEPRDSMLDPKYIGGIVGGKGYAFQNAYILHRLPYWLADPALVGLQPEDWDDVEVFFEDEAGKRREAIQVKDHPVTPSEAKGIFHEFQHRADEGQRNGIAYRFRLASLGVSKELQPVKNGVELYQARTGYSEAEKTGTRDDVARHIDKLGLEVPVEFLLERVIFETDLWDVSKEDVLRNDLTMRLHRMMDYGLSLLDAEYAYVQLARSLDRWLKEKRHIPRQDIEDIIRSEAGRHPQVSPQPALHLLHQLPADLADFTGRTGEIRELLTLLGDGGGGAAISAIGGMGGVGKSALAVHVAHQLARSYPKAQIVVDLRGTKENPLTPMEAMAQVIRAFQPEARLPDDADQVMAIYCDTLDGKRALLLLDDAAGADQVRSLLPPAGCGLIVTSRRVFTLPGLCSFNLDALSRDEARGLLLKIVGDGRASEAELDEIARLCGRLPLALRVAGSFLAVHADWTAAEYVEALSDERQRLARLKVDDLDVEAVLGLSAAQLVREQPELAMRWQMLAVFPAPFERTAAAAVWDVEGGEARDDLSALVERSLLLYDEKECSYRLHDLMRLVAENSDPPAGFKPAGGLAEAAARHAAYYLVVGRQADELYMQGGEHVLEGLRLFDEAWPHLLTAYARMKARDDDLAASWLNDFPDRMAYVLDLRLPPREQIPILETALRAARRLADRQAEGVHLGNLGSAYLVLDEARRAIEYYEQQLIIVREIGHRRGEGHALGNLGLAYADLGEARRAIEYYQQAQAIFDELGDKRSRGNSLGNLGLAYDDLGDSRRAIEFYEQQLVIVREIGDRRGEGNALANMGLLAEQQGDLARARELWEQALRIFEAIEDPNAERVRAWLARLG